VVPDNHNFFSLSTSMKAFAPEAQWFLSVGGKHPISSVVVIRIG
jgi:hypothetical protein